MNPAPALELVMISALEHWSYCRRQCGIIHLEQTFDDNVYTVRGNNAHTRAHSDEVDVEEQVRVVRGLPLWSRELGLVGKADIVELRPSGPYPVEYKVGRRNRWGHDDIQLAAQAVCLEEMLRVPVTKGAVFHRGSRRRREVFVGDELRELVCAATVGVRAMLLSGAMPVPVNDARCPRCSLYDTCQPVMVARQRRSALFHREVFRLGPPGN